MSYNNMIFGWTINLVCIISKACQAVILFFLFSKYEYNILIQHMGNVSLNLTVKEQKAKLLWLEWHLLSVYIHLCFYSLNNASRTPLLLPFIFSKFLSVVTLSHSVCQSSSAGHAKNDLSSVFSLSKRPPLALRLYWNTSACFIHALRIPPEGQVSLGNEARHSLFSFSVFPLLQAQGL